MKVYVVFDFPEITDANSEDADNAISILQDELSHMDSLGYDWYIDDAEGDL